MKRFVDRALRPAFRYLHTTGREKVGIGRTMSLARRYNGMFTGNLLRLRERMYRECFDELIEENGPCRMTPNRMVDGLALDTSGNLPFLEELLKESDELIEERAGRKEASDAYRSFFRNMITAKDLERWPAFIDFITASEVISTVCHYLKYIPCLSSTLPPGVRFVESWKKYDVLADSPPRDSQLYHMDPYGTPIAYVIVLPREVTMTQGPFHYFGEEESQRIAGKIDYWAPGKPFRVPDEEIHAHLDTSKERILTLPRGTVLFIDPSRCFHYGSRNSEDPRYMIMYGLTSPVRTDFSESIMPEWRVKPVQTDSRLRCMVLDKLYRG